MHSIRHPSSTRADLARLLLGWLIVILFVQGMAAAVAFVAGPLHHHRLSASAASAAPADHSHSTNDRHHHSHADVTVVQAATDPVMDPAAQAVLAVVFAAMALAQAWRLGHERGHVQLAAPLWAMANRHPTPARRPPRC